MSDIAIRFENVGKLYRLGTVGTGTIAHDIQRWWTTSVLHKDDPYLKIGETNDRSTKGHSDYVYALKDITFDVKQGEVLGIIGKNGAGKSTLLKLLSRVTYPTTGNIYVKGRIASLLEVGTGFHPELTGRENIYMNGSILGMKKHEIDRKLDEIVDFSGCERYLDTPVKRYSSGMMVRLGFAVAAHLDPEILVVDEVLAVGDAEFQKKAIGKMQDVSKGEGRTVLFVSHNMDSVINLCKTGILLDSGSIVFNGSAKSTVYKYLGASKSQSVFINETPKTGIFVKKVSFGKGKEMEQGLFPFNVPITLCLIIGKQNNYIVNPNTVVGVCIQTSTKKMVSVSEIKLDNLKKNASLGIIIQYPACILMPGNYIVQIDIHVPNQYYIDRQETVSFRVFDNGSEFLKYGANDNGIVFLNPSIKIYNE